MRRMHKAVFLALMLGFSAMAGQVLLLREFVTAFYGNETAYAVVLASWFFWVATGSFAVSRLRRVFNQSEPWLLVTLAALSVILPLTMIAVRCLRTVLHIPVGEIIGIPAMAGAAFVFLAPLAVVLGMVYTLICRSAESEKPSAGDSGWVSDVYLSEALGSAVGGLIFSLVLVRMFPALSIAFLLAVLNLGAVVILGWGKMVLRLAALTAVLAVVAALGSGGVRRLDGMSRQVQWRGLEVLAVTDSIYGNIALTRIGNAMSLFENGILSFTTREEYGSEEAMHFPMLSHPAPYAVALIGSGLSGSLEEILKHPSVRGVDYFELDPKAAALAEKFLSPELLAPRRDQRVNAEFVDARLRLKRTLKKYDVVIVRLGDPYNAMLNRYYTAGFFREVRRVLNPGGVFSLSVSSSENYLSEEARAFLRSINTTLKTVFPDVVAVPGDTNIFLASAGPRTLSRDPGLFVSRLKERGIETAYVREYYLPYKLSPDRIQYINEVLSEEGMRNTDGHPVAYLFDILLWSSHFNGSFPALIRSLRRLSFWPGLGLLFLLGVSGRAAVRRSPAAAVTLSIMTTGFSEIVFQIIVILMFQTLYGYAYYQIGLIMASFMLGLVFGSLAAKRLARRSVPSQRACYLWTQAAICLYPLFLPVVFFLFRDVFAPHERSGLFAAVFASLPVIAGFVGGVQYPLAVSLVSRLTDKPAPLSSAAGELYALDVLGATLGALVTGTVLIPVWGIVPVALFVAAVNVMVLLFLSRMPRPSH